MKYFDKIHTCINKVFHMFTVDGENSKSQTGLIIGVSAGLALLLVAGIILAGYFFKRLVLLEILNFLYLTMCLDKLNVHVM